MDDPIGMIEYRKRLPGIYDDLVSRRISLARFQRKSHSRNGAHGPVLVIMLEESWNLAADGARANRVAMRRTQRAVAPSQKEPTL